MYYRLKRLRLFAQGFYRRLHSGYVTVMVRAQDVYQFCVASVVFVFMVGYIRQEISRSAVGAYQDAVFIVVVGAGAEPYRSVFFVDFVLFF